MIYCCTIRLLDAGYGTDVPKTEWSLLLSIPCVLIGLPFMWLFLIDLGAKWADTLSNSIQQFRWNLARRYPDVVSLHADSSGALGTSRFLPSLPQNLNQNGLERFSEEAPAVRPYQNGGRISQLANGDAQDSRFLSQGTDGSASPNLRSVWTVEPVAVAMMPDAPLKAAKLSKAPADDMYHHATPWVATVFIVLYPFVGSLIFGLWANLPVTTSFVLPLTSLMLISPPAVFTSFLWRTMFHLYLLIGWVLLIACFLLWHQSWRDVIRNWAHDLSIKQYQKTYPLQVR